jgi:hypothetical protein
VQETKSSSPSHHDVPSFRPWLRVMAGALIPILIAFFVPDAARIYLFAIAGLGLVAGLVMFFKEEGAANRR